MAQKHNPFYRPPDGTQICRLSALPDKTARGFTLKAADGRRLDMIVWRMGDAVCGFVNQCPHLGLPLETFPDRFLSADGTRLICSAHGAQFDAHGQCIAGPCRGRALIPLGVGIADNAQGQKVIVLRDSARHS